MCGPGYGKGWLSDHEEKPGTRYGDSHHPERDGNGCLRSKYIRSPADRFGSGGADRDLHCYIDTDTDTDANCNLYGHAYCDVDAYRHFYCHADADSDADLYYGYAYCDADAYRYFYCHACPERSRRASTDSDDCPTHGHADASVSLLA